MNIGKIPINPARWFKRKPAVSATPKIDALSVTPKGETVGIYGKSGIQNSQEDETVPKISKVHPPTAAQAPGYFVPGSEAKEPAKPTIGPLTPAQAFASGADSVTIHKDGSASIVGTTPPPDPKPIEYATESNVAKVSPVIAPAALWELDGQTFTSERAATAQADADQRLAAEKLAASTPIAVEPETAPIQTVIKPATVSAAPVKETAMSAATGTSAPKENFVQKVETVLDKVANFFQTKINPIIKDADTVATDIEPFVNLAVPGWSGLYDTVVNLIGQAEAAGSAAGDTGTGAQKMASVLAALTPLATSYLASIGVTSPTLAQIQSYVQSVYDGLTIFNTLATGAALPATTVPATT